VTRRHPASCSVKLMLEGKETNKKTTAEKKKKKKKREREKEDRLAIKANITKAKKEFDT
jgi:hypothetical protein